VNTIVKMSRRRFAHSTGGIIVLNDHGTVLVRYHPDSKTPEQLAEAVHRALATGWNCTARVDRGEQRPVTIQLEGRPYEYFYRDCRCLN